MERGRSQTEGQRDTARQRRDGGAVCLFWQGGGAPAEAGQAEVQRGGGDEVEEEDGEEEEEEDTRQYVEVHIQGWQKAVMA